MTFWQRVGSALGIGGPPLLPRLPARQTVTDVGQAMRWRSTSGEQPAGEVEVYQQSHRIYRGERDRPRGDLRVAPEHPEQVGHGEAEHGGAGHPAHDAREQAQRRGRIALPGEGDRCAISPQATPRREPVASSNRALGSSAAHVCL